VSATVVAATAGEGDDRVRPHLILAADFGSSGVKASLFDRDLSPVASASKEYPTERPRAGRAEQRPERLWEAFRSVCAALFRKASVSGGRITVIGISSHYPSMLPVDASGDALVPAQTWMDERGAPYCDRVEEALSSSERRVNGNPVEGFYPLPKVLWLREHRPDVFERTASFVQLHAYLAGRLTGEGAFCDRTATSWFHNYDLWNDAWADRVTRALDLQPTMFPQVRPASDVVGQVTAAAARDCGLAAGTPVILGTGDAVAAALGAGVAEPGQAYMTTGTGGCVCVVTPEPCFQRGLVTEAYVLPGSWLIEGIIKNIGVLLQWYVREFGRLERESAEAKGVSPYALLDAEAAASAPGSGGLVCLPYFSGEQSPVNDASSRGVLFGLTLATTRGDIIRALLEAVAYAVTHNLEAIRDVGASVSELRVTGGPATSDLWAQMIADVTGLPIARPRIAETAPLGVAMLAARGIGEIGDLTEAREVVEIERRFEPRDAIHAGYAERYETYKELYLRTRPLYAGLPELHGAGEV
jgi:xylulokinase